MKNEVMECAQCGAPLPPSTGRTEVRCTYCNAVNNIKKDSPPPPRPQPPSPVRRPTPVPATDPPKKGGCGIVLVVILLIGAGIGAAVFFLYEPFHLWDGNCGPVYTDINGRTMMFGRVRLVRDDDQLFIQGTWADTGEKAWRFGPMGDFSTGSSSVRYALSGSALIVSGPRSELRALDPATGAVRYGVQLSDAAKKLCVTSDPNKLYVETVDERRMMLDIPTGALSEYPNEGFRRCDPMPTSVLEADDGDASPEPVLEGYRLLRTWRDSRHGVAVMEKSPGTPHPIVVGFSPATGQVTWQSPLSLADPISVKEPGTNDYPGTISAGRFVAAFAVGNEERRIACFDVNTGNRLWDVELKELFAVDWVNRVDASARQVFVERTSSLDIYDLASGALIDTVGDDSYE